MTTIGGHNLHDEAGVPTFFADVVFFTEAIAPTIVAKAKRLAAHARARLAGYAVVVCAEQPDLVIAYRRCVFKAASRSYTRYVTGVPKVTPNRGTFVIMGTDRASGAPTALVVEHRINAAFPPYIRGEGEFRHAAWMRQTDGSVDTIERLKSSGYHVRAGGDLNALLNRPMQGYRGQLDEVGKSLDRLGCWPERLVDVTYLSNEKSDHPRLRARVGTPASRGGTRPT